MDERLELEGATLAQAGEHFAREIGRASFTEEQTRAIASLLEQAAGDDGSVRFELEPVPVLQQRGRVPGTVLFVNAPRAAVMLSALLVDALLTRGLAVGALALAGYPMQALARLRKETGEFCNYVSLAATPPRQLSGRG